MDEGGKYRKLYRYTRKYNLAMIESVVAQENWVNRYLRVVRTYVSSMTFFSESRHEVVLTIESRLSRGPSRSEYCIDICDISL